MNPEIRRLDIRGLDYHVNEWGDSSLPKLFMLHGWMDCGESFKFMAPYLVEHFHLIAPDLRGFGDTEHVPGGYYFPDYFADLELLIDHYAPQDKVKLVGHSMGGNIVKMYAGIRPERVAAVLSLEALGLPPTEPADAPQKYRDWMREILSGEPSKVYPNADMLKQSIYKGNPSLPIEIIEELAVMWGRQIDDSGAMMLKHDHKHRYTNPVRYNYDDVLAVWREVSARVGLVMAEKSVLYQRFEAAGRIAEAREVLGIADEDYFVVPDAHHMLHLEQPERSADCVLRFFS